MLDVKKDKNTVLWMKQGLVSPCVWKWFLHLAFVFSNMYHFWTWINSSFLIEMGDVILYIWFMKPWELAMIFVYFIRLLSLSLVEIMLGRYSFSYSNYKYEKSFQFMSEPTLNKSSTLNTRGFLHNFMTTWFNAIYCF